MTREINGEVFMSLNGLESTCKFLVEEQIKVYFLPCMVTIQVHVSSERTKRICSDL